MQKKNQSSERVKSMHSLKKLIILLVFKGIIAYIQVVVAPKRVWGPSNFISNFKFTKFHKIPTAVSISEEWPGDPGGTHSRRKFIRE